MKQATLIVSLDFELFWGMQDSHTLSEYENHVLGGRKAIPRLLKLFQKYGIHATSPSDSNLRRTNRASESIFLRQNLHTIMRNYPAIDALGRLGKMRQRHRVSMRPVSSGRLRIHRIRKSEAIHFRITTAENRVRPFSSSAKI